MRDVLEITPDANATNARLCIRIRDAEQLLGIYYPENTLKVRNFRDPRYHDDSKRQGLREQIIDELWTMPRLPDDDKIRLKKGGLLTKEGFQQGKKFFLVTGLPASGKSTITNHIAAGSGAVIIDSDFAKRKFPEFQADYGAALVHDEARMITEGVIADAGYEGPSLLDSAVSEDYNVVMPKIGHNYKNANSILQFFNKNGYSCYFVHVEVDRSTATKRAFDRFKKTKRYVPLSLIFDEYSNNPTLQYLKLKRSQLLAGHIHISTESQPLNIIEHENCDDIKQWIEEMKP